MKRFSGYALMASAFVACPCHLPLTLPILLALVGGSSLGTFLATRTDLVFVAALVYFVVGIVAGLVLLNRRSGRLASSRPERGCPVQNPVQNKEGVVL